MTVERTEKIAAKRAGRSSHGWFRAMLAQVSRVEKTTIAIVVIAAAAVFAFALLAEEVMEGGTRAFDQAVLLALRNPSDPSDPLGPRWLEEMMRDFTALGGTAVLVAVTLAVIGFLLMTGKRHAALMVASSVFAGIVLSQSLKWGFARPRPDLVPHSVTVYTHSFPSGHAMMAAIVYLTLGALLARTQPRRRVKAYLLSVAATFTLLVGVSRIYLGVHWPTDVLAGWAGGAAFALACWLVMIWLQGRGQVETAGDGGR